MQGADLARREALGAVHHLFDVKPVDLSF